MSRACLFTLLLLSFSYAHADGRQIVTDPIDPEGTVGRLTTPRNRYCTATSVGRNILLTTARCILDQKTGQIITGDYVFRTVYRGREHTARILKFVVGTTDYKNAVANWAFLQTDWDIGVKVGAMGVEQTAASEFRDFGSRPLRALTYPHDLGSGSQLYLEIGCEFTGTSLDGNLMTHDCAMSSTTGSPIYVHDPVKDTNRIVAMTTADGADHTVAIPSANFFEKLSQLRKEWR